MQKTIDAFWRAAAYCLHPRVIWLSLAPLLVAVLLAVGLAHFLWEDAVTGVRTVLDHWAVSQTLLSWLDTIGASGFRTVVAPLVVVVLSVPLLVVLSLLLVATLMMPALVRLVIQRRFNGLEVRHEAPWWTSLGWSFGATVVAVLVMVVSLPLWLIPPFGLVLPPLIWGWLTYRVMAFDALANHATAQERSTLLTEHRMPLLVMGVITGYLGAAPSALWAVMGAFSVVLAPLLIVASVWVYTLVFAFSSLWFTHYLLTALRDLRAVETPPPLPLVERIA